MEKTIYRSAQDFKITGNWEEQKKGLKEKFTELTDTDLYFETGKENELIKRIELKLNKKRDEVIAILNNGHSKKG